MSAPMMSAAQAPAAESAEVEALELEALLAARAYLYALFHKALGATPDAEVIDALLSTATADAVGEYAADDETMCGLGAFLSELAAHDDRAALLEAARDEHTRLFVGPGQLPALPWESPYRTREAIAFQESTLAVRRAYRERGWEPKRLQRVPDDHVALECAFMAKLAAEALEAFRAGDAAGLPAALRGQRTFVGEHMAGWLGEYAKDVRRSKTAVLYPQLVEALAAFVKLDAVFLDEAAFWAEERAGEGGWDAAVPGSAAAEAFARLDAARARVEVLRPFGVEDCELEEAGKAAS